MIGDPNKRRGLKSRERNITAQEENRLGSIVRTHILYRPVGFGQVLGLIELSKSSVTYWPNRPEKNGAPAEPHTRR